MGVEFEGEDGHNFTISRSELTSRNSSLAVFRRKRKQRMSLILDVIMIGVFLNTVPDHHLFPPPSLLYTYMKYDSIELYLFSGIDDRVGDKGRL